MIKVLFVAANPFYRDFDVEFDEELYVIRRALKGAKYRDRIDLIEAVAVELGELDSLISMYQPEIVHISVPAHPHAGFYFQEIDELSANIDDVYRGLIKTSATVGQHGSAMSETFRPFAKFLKCVICNTPLFPSGAEELARYSESVIAWPNFVYWDRCIAFSEAFYNMLGTGNNIRSAFLAGRRRALLTDVPFSAAEPYRIVDEYRELTDIDISTVSPRNNVQRLPLRALYLAAVPTHHRGGATLNLAKEVRLIQKKIQRGPLREQSELRVEWAVRIHELQDHLLEHDPILLIIGGHAGREGVLMKDRDGKEKLVGVDIISSALKVAGKNVKCVILNGCNTVEMAQIIANETGTAIGMTDAIPDDIAIIYAEGFFRGISYKKSIKEAHEMGLHSMLENNQNGSANYWMKVPRLFVGSELTDQEVLWS